MFVVIYLLSFFTEKLYFIDFEYGSYSYRVYDIANHFHECVGFDCDYNLYVLILLVEQFDGALPSCAVALYYSLGCFLQVPRQRCTIPLLPELSSRDKARYVNSIHYHLWTKPTESYPQVVHVYPISATTRNLLK